MFFLVFSGVCYVALYRLYILGPNTYEQGYMYTAAVAFENGSLPHKDFFMQYGPTVPAIQGSWMKLFGTDLIQLQHVTLLSLILTSMLLFIILRIRWSFFWSTILTLFWLMSGPHGNPWSSVWSNFFALLGIFLIETITEVGIITVLPISSIVGFSLLSI